VRDTDATASTEHVQRGAPQPVAVADLLGRARHENFSVAPWFLPARRRRDLMALYGFARLVDEIGDELDGDRLAMLDWADAEIERAAAGTATGPIFRDLTDVIERHALPLQPFHDLVEANRVDQSTHHYQTFEDLRGYCRLSAEPVGRLVLATFGAATEERLVWSDDVCTALQLVEHWQDVGEDAARGRVYLPAEHLDRFDCTASDLLAAHAGEALSMLMLSEVRRARGLLLRSGVALVASLHGRLRLLVAGFVAGGHAGLDAIEAVDGDVLGHRCAPTMTRTLANTIGVMRISSRHRRARR
jgi:squalene synthase HpnC